MTTPNLPIGSANLPIGAFTPSSLATTLQSFTKGKYVDQVGGRFPSIVSGTPAGSPLSDLSPVGIITGILGGFLKSVSESTSTDISNPADLDDLIVDFFEGLPLVGEVIDLLQAILGEYTGDDPIFLQIQSLFGFLRGDGMLDASYLFGDLPDALVDGLRGLIGAVFDPSWLSNLVPAQIGSGWSDNLLTNPLFDGAISLISGAGWSHNDSVFPAGALGSAEVTADGSRKVLSNKTIRGSAGQTVRAGGLVEWAGPAAAVGRAFTVELRPFTAAGAELPAIDVAGISNPVASSAGVFEEVVADVPWPAGAAWIRTRMAVEPSVPAGTTVRWSKLETRKGGAMPQDRIANLVPDLGALGSNFLGLGNAVAGFLQGAGAPTTGGSGDPVLDWVRDALGLFASSANQTSQTADEAQGVGSNALTNTVSIQTQLQGVVERADQGWSARPLWAGMDYTGDATFPLVNMAMVTAHSHGVSTSGTTGTESSHSHYSYTADGSSFNATSNSGAHSHTFSSSGSTSTDGSAVAPCVLTSTAAYMGYIRCGSTQEKRLFSFLAFSTGVVSSLNLDVYRMASDGSLALVYSSASSFHGALTTSLAWVQHTIPSGTASINVVGGDVLAIQLRMTGAGSVSLGGITSAIPINPPGWLPRRLSAVRNPSTPAPATIAAATANAAHTSAAIPFIEAAIDTGLANAPLSLADNFDGSLSQLWMMSGPNTLGISSNNFGIVDGNSDGWSWGKFQQQCRTDQTKVGFTTTAPSAEGQVVWFHGNDPLNHVGLWITSTTATIYTMTAGASTNRASSASGTSSGAAWTLEYNSATKVYTAKRAGATVVTWTDSGSLAPTGLGNRYGGVGLHATRSGFFGITFTAAAPIDNWLMADI